MDDERGDLLGPPHGTTLAAKPENFNVSTVESRGTFLS